MDDAADAALEKELAKGSADAELLDVPFKRQWDAGLEAELEAALAGFNAANFEVASPAAAPRSDRVRSGDRDRGQEGRPGARTGKVIGVRGKSLFVDLGGKSEGVISVTEFEEGKLPEPGTSIEVIVERFDPAEGIQLLRLKGSAIEADWDNLKKGVIVEARGAAIRPSKGASGS